MKSPFVLALTACAALALAQPVSFGVKGGPSLTGWYTIEGGRNSYTDESGRYTVGPMAEVRLPCCLRLEVDALYRHLGSTDSGGIGGYYFSGSSRAATWEFPALLKYSFRREGPFRPFAGAGPVYRRAGKQHVVSTCTGDLCGSAAGTQTYTLPKFTSLGIVLTAGAEVKTVLPRLSAEIRWSRFERDQGDTGGTQLRTNQNQFVLLFGVIF